MNKEKTMEMQLQLQRFYSLWKDCNAAYEEWSKAQGLSSNAVWVFYALYDNEKGCTQKEICRDWSIPKQTVNTILKDFSAKGYIEMLSVQEDKRNKLIRLTQSGQEFAGKIIGRLHQLEFYALSRMGVEDMKRTNDGMELFTKLFREGDLNENE